MTAAAPGFETEPGWRLHPQVALRPETFGALLYHFGTRKLSFLKNRTVVGIVQSLPEHSTIADAIDAAGVDEQSRHLYVHALTTLASSDMLVRAGQSAA
ncbi:mycofactocin biosynthesis chaperone MftB [Tomitella cavernea]|uniref:mycofactocin biosynthesis chaperone MftB n=1 Tax=Tomitella cavernea TaxID=1387982 RepID=UPI0019042568|nr:mycofactocin biosynthesis chaperone MftB [Tomitella cavernea]